MYLFVFLLLLLNLEKSEISNKTVSVIEIGQLEVAHVFEEKGKISWYGEKFHNKKTASGVLYDKNKLTCASPTLPFGTKILIKNKEKSIVVTVTDRGPYKCYVKNNKVYPVYPLTPHENRIFDLSEKAFSCLSNTNIGVLDIQYRILI